MTQPIRILIADDHPMVRQGLCQICEAEPGLHVVGEAADGHEAYRLALLLQPDVVVMDLAMPVLDGVQATRHLTDDASRIGVIILTVCRDEAYVLEALKAGARAYLQKDADSDTLLHAIRTVAAGESIVDALLAQTLLDEYRHQQSDPGVSNGLTHLTTRDLELLRLVAQGYEVDLICQRLQLSEPLLRQRLTLMATRLHDYAHAD